jgi:putative oxidoreductase
MKIYEAFVDFANGLSFSILALVCRLAAAVPFWRSGQSKLDSEALLGIKFNIFAIKDSKFYLFQEQYGFPEAIATPATYLAAWGEFFLPLLLVFGLFSRFGALGLLAMTAVIQFYVFPEDLLNPNGNWSLHLLWAAPLLLVLSQGPGRFSLDALLGFEKTK